MKYFSSDDYEISYDTSRVNRLISEGEQTLELLVKNTNNLVNSITTLEKLAHDKEATKIDEDYKDFAIIFGEEGIKDFVANMETVFETLRMAMKEYENIVRQNQIRREEERRQEEERKAREFNSFRL